MIAASPARPHVRPIALPLLLPLLLSLLPCLGAPLAAPALHAQLQYDARPWREWRSLDTRHFTVHFPREAEPWARPVAERMDAVRELVGGIVGYAPPHRVQIVVDDPYATANGFAVPVLDRPIAVFWTTPPTPRQSIGHFRGWGELLAVHEYAHLAHLTIPSRNPRERLLMALSPWKGSPVATRAPRWVIEGYATYVEGRITASGRPHNAWRAAILRQWALEGRLPTYGQLNSTDGYLAGSFAYLAGSAFLEHVARGDTLSPHPDSSLAYLWRRLSARKKRSFDAAFAGLHGIAPGDAYARFVAGLSADAQAIRASIDSAGGTVEGALVQRLSWETGDPAISPDGERVAVVLRSRDAPSRVVVWRTGSDSAAADSARRARAARGERGTRREREAAERARRDSAAARRDTVDVADRRFVPPSRQALATLRAPAGASYEAPRFLRDGRRVLLTRLSPMGDGSLRHDVYMWDTRGGGVRRVTRGAGIRDADPSPDDSAAVGVRCRYGSCDLVRVSLSTGEVTELVAGTPTRTFHRPRWSPDGQRIVAAMHEGGRWRLVVAARDGSDLRTVGGDDAPARFEPAFTRSSDTVIAVSERGGIMNLERVPLDGGAAVTLTRVTGAALAPEPNRADGSVWFLAMHSRGLDVRRLGPGDSARAATVVRFDTTLAPLVPMVATQTPATLARAELPAARGYGAGPRDLRWLPAGSGGVDGYAGRLVLSSADLLGRLHVVATGAAGDPATWRGGSLAFASRAWCPVLWGEGTLMRQRPSLSRASGWEREPVAMALDAEHRAAALGVEVGSDWQTHALRARLGGQLGEVEMIPVGARVSRPVGALLVDATVRQRGAGWSRAQRLVVQSSAGRLGDRSFTRSLATLGVGSAGRETVNVNGAITYGTLHGDAAPYERFVVGGVGGALMDPMFLSQRVTQPLLPLGAATGTRLLAFRAAAPVGPWSVVYSGASTNDGGRFARWQRTVAAELSFATPAIPLVSVPAASLVGGVGRALDQRGRPIRGYFNVVLRP